MLALAVQVQKADDNMESGMALVTVHIDHAQYDMGREVQCLNAIIKGDVPLQVIRMTGPDLVLGALASMAAYPNMLLRAAELRQASCYIVSIPACSVAASKGAWGHLGRQSTFMLLPTHFGTVCVVSEVCLTLACCCTDEHCILYIA
jgi:hypothetical protein